MDNNHYSIADKINIEGESTKIAYQLNDYIFLFENKKNNVKCTVANEYLDIIATAKFNDMNISGAIDNFNLAFDFIDFDEFVDRSELILLETETINLNKNIKEDRFFNSKSDCIALYKLREETFIEDDTLDFMDLKHHKLVKVENLESLFKGNKNTNLLDIAERIEEKNELEETDVLGVKIDDDIKYYTDFPNAREINRTFIDMLYINQIAEIVQKEDEQKSLDELTQDFENGKNVDLQSYIKASKIEEKRVVTEELVEKRPSLLAKIREYKALIYANTHNIEEDNLERKR